MPPGCPDGTPSASSSDSSSMELSTMLHFAAFLSHHVFGIYTMARCVKLPMEKAMYHRPTVIRTWWHHQACDAIYAGALMCWLSGYALPALPNLSARTIDHDDIVEHVKKNWALIMIMSMLIINTQPNPHMPHTCVKNQISLHASSPHNAWMLLNKFCCGATDHQLPAHT